MQNLQDYKFRFLLARLMPKTKTNQKTEVLIMKIYPWLDCTTVAVVGTRYALGEGNEVLDQLEDAGWIIDAKESSDIRSEIYQYFYHAEGMLLPEPENPADPKAVAVYLKFKATKKSMRPHRIAVKIGYLPRDSDYRAKIKRATLVKIHCLDTYSDANPGHDFSASVMDSPLKLTSGEYKKHAMKLDLE